jgi:hypothetical protein
MVVLYRKRVGQAVVVVRVLTCVLMWAESCVQSLLKIRKAEKRNGRKGRGKGS